MKPCRRQSCLDAYQCVAVCDCEKSSFASFYAGHHLCSFPAKDDALHKMKRFFRQKSCSCASLCCSVMRCITVCCSVLRVAVCRQKSSLCVSVCCSVLQCIAVYCSVSQCVAACCSKLQYVAVCCSVLQCVAVCTVLQCVAACSGGKSDEQKVVTAMKRSPSVVKNSQESAL